MHALFFKGSALAFSRCFLIGILFTRLPVPQASGQVTIATPAAAPSAQGAILPETPAGKKFAAWLAALNSGKREALREFIAAEFAPPPNGGELPVDRISDRHSGIYTATGGLELGKVVASPAPERIAIAVRARRTDSWMQIGLGATAEPPHKILGFSFRNSEAPADLLPKTKFSDDEIQKRVDALIDRLVSADQFSGVILVARDGKPIYQRVAGLASRAWKVPNAIDTRFNIASIGKMFTAIAIVQLAEQGKLSYEDTLEKVLPDYPNVEIARKITVGELLNHTSGLTEARGPQSGDNAFKLGCRKVNEYLAGAAKDTLAFEPGTKLEYSSYGYLVLGAIIEKVSGQDYYDYVREHIHRPAGMQNSDCYELDADPPNLAIGYMDAPDRQRRSNTFKLPVKGLPYGLGYSTAEDLVRFSTALREHKLVSAASLEKAWTGNMAHSEFESKYGYGFIVKRYNGVRVVGHGGGWLGITNKFDMYPELGLTVVILNNIDSDPNAIAFKLREWLTQGNSAGSY